MRAVKALFSEFRSGTGLKGQLLRGGLWSLVIRLMSTLMALGLAVVLARLLGPEGFGIYSFVFALVSILAIPAQLGLPNLVVRETAKAQANGQWDVMRGLWRWSSLVALTMSVVLIALGGLFAWIFANRLGAAQAETLWWGLALVPLIALGNLRGAALRGLRRVVQGQLPEFVLRPGLLILLALGVWMLFGAIGPAEAMMLHVIASAVAFVVGAALLLRAHPRELRQQKAATTHTGPWLASTIPLAMIGGMQIINQNVGVVILGMFRTPEEVGLFRVALQGATLVTFGLMAANLIAAPHIARLHSQGDLQRLRRLLTQSARAVLGLALPVALLFYLIGRMLLTVFFGANFEGAYWPLIILLGGQLVNAFVASGGVLLNMTDHEQDVAVGLAAGLVANAILAILLIPYLGVIGAAIASSVARALWNLFIWLRARNHLGIDPSALGLAPISIRTET